MSSQASVELRIGWLLWEGELKEFLYFEESMSKPNPDEYYAEWNVTPPRGARKPSKSLWIYERKTDKKRYSVTTGAGIKIQPYFDVPPPNDPNLTYFRVQSEIIDNDTVILWVTSETAHRVREKLGSINKETVSRAVLGAKGDSLKNSKLAADDLRVAVPIEITKKAFDHLKGNWEAVNDDHSIQLLIQSL